jgi:hypothetical protein
MLAVMMEANPMGMKAYRQQKTEKIWVMFSVPHGLAISITKHPLRQE